MARPREYNRDVVVHAAEEAFWRRGYEASDLHVLEQATQLSRSSMYLAFGSKRGLFDEAVAEYWSTFTESLLGPVESENATTVDAAGFFAATASLFRGDLGSRGCLIVNAIGELAGRDASMARQGADLYERYRLAFANALGAGSGGSARDQGVIGDRAQMLAVSAMGVWITSRVNPAAAAQACDAIVKQITVWAHPTPRRRPATRS
ncbi:MAG: TetR/AcrR family transcriptional regulator [Ilumatobacteraceae bacterium]